MGVGSWLSSLFSAASSTVTGLPITTWLKIGAVVAVAVAFGGLYWWGSHESSKVTDLTKQTGAQAQIIADDKVNLGAYEAANQNWAKAFDQYQKDAQSQADALHNAQAAEEKIHDELSNLESKLAQNPVATVSRLNALNDWTVCMLNHATGGGGSDSCTPATAVAPSVAAPKSR